MVVLLLKMVFVETSITQFRKNCILLSINFSCVCHDKLVKTKVINRAHMLGQYYIPFPT